MFNLAVEPFINTELTMRSYRPNEETHRSIAAPTHDFLHDHKLENLNKKCFFNENTRNFKINFSISFSDCSVFYCYSVKGRYFLCGVVSSSQYLTCWQWEGSFKVAHKFMTADFNKIKSIWIQCLCTWHAYYTFYCVTPRVVKTIIILIYPVLINVFTIVFV